MKFLNAKQPARMKHVLLAITAIFFGISMSSAQSIEKKWQFQSVEYGNGESTQEFSKSDVFILDNGDFNYTIQSNNLQASGDYIHQNNLLIFYYENLFDLTSVFLLRNKIILRYIDRYKI